jgi:hypothetical protein
LPVSYYHVVFTLPAPIAHIAYQNRAVVYDLLFKVSADTMLTIAVCRTALRSLSAVSLGGFRTPASELAAPSLKRPASENP